ncbi:MAG TPA: Ig-like domain-containing protein [Kofleriaceae bacterium]|nr:Ig-like domain-containing protein [Kofleriaceae bacterium]
MKKLVCLALALAAGCSVPSVTFTGEPDTNTNPDTPHGGVDGGPVAIMVTPTSVTSLNEGSMTMLMVQLTNQPSPAGVVVDIAPSAVDKLGLSKAQIQFSDSDWDQPRAITVTALQDPDTVDDSAMVMFTTTLTGIDEVDVPVSIIDDDKLALIVNPPSLDVLENGSAPLMAHLNAQPASDVVVTVASGSPSIASVTPAMLTFTPSNYAIDQSVTVSGKKDANKVNDSANILFISGALSQVSVPVNVIDIDVLGIAPSTTSLQMNEGDVKTFTVALTQAPTTNVTINLASTKPTGASVAPPSLVFTPSNWSQGQTVTVTAPQDDDTANEAVVLNLTSPPLNAVAVAVAVADDDTQSIIVNPTTVGLGENGSKTVAVHLAFRPTANLDVSIMSANNQVATASPAQLTFTPSSFAADQTVTISAPDDADAVDNVTTITFADPADGLSTPASISVTDDDVLQIETNMPSVTLDEGTTATFQVRLTAQPQGDTQVAIVSTDVGAATVSTGALTFTTSNWNVFQTVTVTGVGDVDTADEHVEIDLTANGMTLVPVTANVMDTTGLNIMASTNTLNVTEGSNATFSVVLTAQPPGNVTVAVDSADTNVATTSPASLVFTPVNWNVAQVVTVTGVTDANATDGTTTVTLSATGLNSRTVAITNKDVDVLGIAAAQPSLSVGEGKAANLGIHLTAQPAADTVVTLMSSNATKAMLSPSSMTFTTANWNVDQIVTVTGVQDADAVDESLNLTASATGLTTLTVPVTVVDDEVLGIVVDSATVTLGEGGTTTFNAHLAAQPSGTTMVMVVSGNPGKASVGPALLSFDGTNYMTDQPITVTGVQDNDLADESVTITLSSTGFPNRVVTAGVTDDDTQAVVVTSQSVTVNEGTTNTVGVSLAFQPSANVVVSVTSTDPTTASVNPSSLTFTPQNYDTPQNVTITGVEDSNAIADSTTLTMSAAGATPASVTVNVPDNDTLGIVTSVATLSFAETGTGTIGFKLSAQPQANTTVTIASSNTAKATVSPASLTFTTSNWNAFQNVTVTGVHDVDAVDASINVTGTSAPLATATVPTTVTDVDSVTIVTSVSSVSLAEGGTGTYTVKLAAQPQANVTVNITSPNTAKATVSPAMMTFTTSNWNVAQTETVTGVQDQDIADETVSLQVASSGLPTVNVTANVADDDTEQILVANNSVSVNESASTTVGVTLRYIPSGNVTVNLASSDTAVATVSPTTMTFSPGNYNVAQSVTITGVKDANAAPDTASVSLTSAGVTAASIAVTVNDIDTLGFTTAPSSVTVAEGGTQPYTVTLTAQPQGNTTVTLTSNNPNAATVSPGTLTFTTSNWNAPQTVTVTGAQDANLTNESTSISMTASGVTTGNVPVTVTDDDQQKVLASTPSLSVNESASTTFTVTLQYVPAANVTVNLTSNNTSVATVAPVSLTFTPGNYNVAQTVTVTGVHDANTGPDSTMVTATATGAIGATVGVTVNDIDTLGITTDVSSLTRPEDGVGTINVKLNAMPASTVTVIALSQNSNVATSTPTMLTFTTGNYNTYQAITVTGVHDKNTVDDSTTIKLSATGLSDVNVPVTITDVDVLGVAVSKPTLSLTEGQAGQKIGVTLTQIPTGNVTVTIASGNTNLVTTSPPTLTFTPQNYNVSQDATLTAVQDADAANGSTPVSFTAPGATTGTVTVDVTDDDVLGISPSPASLTVAEGGTQNLSVVLSAQPLSPQTVTVVSNDTTKATVNVASLSFDATNWNQAQTVIVTGAQDANLGNESTGITLSSPGMTTQVVPTTIVDDDQETILSDVAAATIVDNGTGNSVVAGISLQYQPAANVVVTVASSNTNVATASPATLTFTPQNYNTKQNVTITGVHDVNVVDDTATVSLTAAGAIGANVAMTVRDTDVVTFVTSVNSLGVTEGSTNTYRVHLSNQPTASVSVTVSSDNTAAATVSPAALTFTTSNWNVDQTITVTGVQDVNVASETLNATQSATGITSKSVTVTTTDNDTQAVLTSGNMTIHENSSGTLQVSLAFQPSSNVTVSLVSNNTSIAAPAVSSLTFTPQNYNIQQPVTINAPIDTNSVNDGALVTGSLSGASNGNAIVTVIDRNLLIRAPATQSICVFDLPAGVSVHWADSPINPTTVNVGTSGHVSSASPSQLSFDSSNYTTSQFVDADGTVGTGTVTFSASGQVTVSASITILSSTNPACCVTCFK